MGHKKNPLDFGGNPDHYVRVTASVRVRLHAWSMGGAAGTAGTAVAVHF